jgi:SUMO ligase MMS21 Smc5/6 complex component
MAHYLVSHHTLVGLKNYVMDSKNPEESEIIIIIIQVQILCPYGNCENKLAQIFSVFCIF